MAHPRDVLEVHLSRGGDAKVRVNGEAFAVSDAQAQDVREMLGSVWAMPSEAAEGCRDGGIKSLLAERGAEWKVVLRHCSVIEPVEAVLELLRRE